MTIYNLYIFDRHCQCIYFQKWTHAPKGSASANTSQTGSRLGSRLSHSTTSSSEPMNTTQLSSHNQSIPEGALLTQQSGMAAGSMISMEEEAKLVYGVILSLRNFVRKLSSTSDHDGFISYRTSTYRLHYYETPTGLKFVLNTDPQTEGMKAVLKQIYVQLYVEFVVKNGLMRFDDTRWEISQGFLSQPQANEDTPHSTSHTSFTPAPPGNISNELFRLAVDRFVRSLSSFEQK
ncbi:snare-like protein [Hesseltinella vesiculosa]|uniref:Trafficking protein particle complex subunit n=1 Tax=Hesseltinella vesiculosa TaxID=101127 RepID=A0A1X2G4H2_9FUNG|nr:snare-like protein [Hesseltinella vesiculosa]